MLDRCSHESLDRLDEFMKGYGWKHAKRRRFYNWLDNYYCVLEKLPDSKLRQEMRNFAQRDRDRWDD